MCSKNKPLFMQKSTLLLITFVLFISNFATGQEPINLLTWNLRYDNPADKENGWANRKDDVVSLLKFFQADLICIQEGLFHQVKYINDSLQSHSYVGVGRDDGIEKGEFCAIFFRKNRFKVLEHQTFWLSDTPEKPTIGWDAAIVRICTWLKVRDLKSKSDFFIFNTHFDHMGKVAREKSAGLILKKMIEINDKNLPVVLCGDFNATDSEKPYEVISGVLSDSRKISKLPPFGPMATFNNFRFDEIPNERIDYIFVNEKFNVVRNGVITQSKNNRYPSDHFPIFSELIFK
jgi:endonuclease/exonuclease/phosphatase family metal-dependent hydrolase